MNEEDNTEQQNNIEEQTNSIDYEPVAVEGKIQRENPQPLNRTDRQRDSAHQYQTRRVTWGDHAEDLKRIRSSVFIEEQEVPAELEWDEEDAAETMHHFLLFENSANDSTQAKATARLKVTHCNEGVDNTNLSEGESPKAAGKLGRMAVLSECRKRGMGRALLQSIVEFAVAEGLHEIYAHAQISALDFYTRNGFNAEKEEKPFMEAGIPHLTVRLDLTDGLWLCQFFKDRILRLSSIQAFTLHASHCITNTRAHLDIFTTRLNPQLFSDAKVVHSISQCARAHPRAKVRILIQDSRELGARTHNLLALAQRLPSIIQVKVLSKDIDRVAQGHIIGDQRHLIYFNDEDEWKGFANYQAAAECEQLSENFNYYWEAHAEYDPNLKRLSL